MMNRGLFLSLALPLMLLASILVSTQKAESVSAIDWRPGNITDDAVFYNNNFLTVNQIQNFLDSKVPNCDTGGTQPATEYRRPDLSHAQYAQLRGWHAPPYICLKNYYQVPRSDQVISNLTTNQIPQGAISAAQIIKNASDQYGVNPAALIATLQKESIGPIVTDTWPLNVQYRNAMGYACPDSAPCDPAYEGFYNQVTNAAKQLKRYRENPGSYKHKPFQNNSILFNPNSSCGSSLVYIENFATAGLYNYTPYQPNAAALSNLYGTGNSCSSYGNRNFWRIFSDWFGSTWGPSGALPINASLGFSNLSPVAGENLDAVFSIKNNSSLSLTFEASIADQNINTGQWNSFPSQNVTLAAGETRQLQFSKKVLYPGPHRSWISIRYGGSWYDAVSHNYQLVNYSYHVKSVADVLPVTASLGFSNLSPAAGENMSVVYSLKNTSSSSITVDASLADKNTQTGQWNSASQQKVTIAPGEIRQLLFTRTILHPGPHTSYVALGQDGSWYAAQPIGSQLVNYSYFVREPNIRLIYYYFENLPPVAGEQISAHLSVANNEPNPIKLNALGVPVYNYTAKSWNTMNSSVIDLTLGPGQTHVMNVTQTLGAAAYQIWPSACVSTYCFTPKDTNGIRQFWRGGI